MALPVTQDDFIAALNGLRSKVPGLVQPLLFTLRQGISDSRKSLNGRAIEEIAGQVLALAAKVEVQQASLAQTVDSAVTAQLALANEGFTNEQCRVTALIEQLRLDISQVAHVKLDEVPALLRKQEADYKADHAAFEERNKAVLDMAHVLLNKDIALIDENIRVWMV